MPAHRYERRALGLLMRQAERRMIAEPPSELRALVTALPYSAHDLDRCLELLVSADGRTIGGTLELAALDGRWIGELVLAGMIERDQAGAWGLSEKGRAIAQVLDAYANPRHVWRSLICEEGPASDCGCEQCTQLLTMREELVPVTALPVEELVRRVRAEALLEHDPQTLEPIPAETRQAVLDFLPATVELIERGRIKPVGEEFGQILWATTSRGERWRARLRAYLGRIRDRFPRWREQGSARRETPSDRWPLGGLAPEKGRRQVSPTSTGKRDRGES